MNIAPKITGSVGRHLSTALIKIGSAINLPTVAIGNQVGYNLSNIAIGDGAAVLTNTSYSSMAIGSNAFTSAENCLAIGTTNNSLGNTFYVTQATNQGAIAIGCGTQFDQGTTASGSQSIAIGSPNASTYAGAQASGSAGSIAIGTGSVASSTSTVALGYRASASGSSSTAIGVTSVASAINSIALGNSASAATTGSICIGNSAKASTSVRQIVIDSSGNGYTHTGLRSLVITTDGTAAYTQDGTVAIGQVPGTTAATNTLLIGAGGYNSISSTATYASIVGGNSGRADMYGESVRANGQFAVAGDAQGSQVIGRISTANATVTEIALDGSTNRIVLIDDSTYLFDVDVVARNTATDTQSAAWNLKFAIRRGAGVATTTLIGTPVKTVFGMDTGTTTWDVNVTADTTNGRPNISVTGEAAKTIRWVANIKISKVTG